MRRHRDFVRGDIGRSLDDCDVRCDFETKAHGPGHVGLFRGIFTVFHGVIESVRPYLENLLICNLIVDQFVYAGIGFQDFCLY